MSNADARRRELAKIHIGASALGMDHETYCAMLWSVARVRSARDLDHAGRRQVLDHLRGLGFRGPPGSRRPHNAESEDRGPQMRKIEAMLTAAGRPWAYVDGMAERMFQVESIAWCNPGQLRAIIAALVYDAKRHGRRP